MTDKEKEIYEFVESIRGRSGQSHSVDTINRLFIYNNLYYPKQTMKNCLSCRRRCYDNLIGWADNMKNNMVEEFNSEDLFPTTPNCCKETKKKVKQKKNGK